MSFSPQGDGSSAPLYTQGHLARHARHAEVELLEQRSFPLSPVESSLSDHLGRDFDILRSGTRNDRSSLADSFPAPQADQRDEGSVPDNQERKVHPPQSGERRIDCPLPGSVQGRQVGARLRHFASIWLSLDCPAWVVSVLSRGYRLRFLSPPPLTTYPPSLGSFNSPKREIRQSLVQDLLVKGAVEHIRDLTSPGFYSLLFLVPKTSGEFRPVIDLSCLNRFLDIPTFRMETAERIRACLRPDFWVTSLDLQDAYFHIPVHPAYRKYLRFQIEKEFFQFCALPFGIATAPW